ncbi:protein tweety homolog 2-like isoform X1 [Clavelina lepadiformis]|uniref:protein tweety homolog 2-like isoform X1 n=2 Tax=Clavelina lepadiformis TaxID=159417 RepID=UPI004042F50A
MEIVSAYSPTEITKILHGIPHLTFKFVLLENPIFTLDDPKYLESLAIVALMPACILLISMIAFLIFYCCVGVKRAAPNKVNSSSCYCSVCLMAIFITLALGAVGVGVYGSIQVHDGSTAASDATSEINKSFSAITVVMTSINGIMDELNEQSDDLIATEVNNSVIDVLVESVSNLSESVTRLPQQTEGANDRLMWMVQLFQLVEYYRTIITFLLIGCHGLVCILALMGICFRSKCLLMATTFIGLICLVATYLYVGSLLMVDVAVADLCMDPYTYIKTQSVDKLYMDNSTALYYLTCSHEDDARDPYHQATKDSLDAAESMETAILEINGLSSKGEDVLDKLYGNVGTMIKRLQSLEGDLQCQGVHTALEEFVPAICISFVEGFFIIGVAFLCFCFALTAILCAAPKTWKRFTSKKTREELDLDDVFLPSNNPRPIVSRTNNPLFVPPDDRHSRRISSNTNLPAATNSLSFFRRSEEDMTLLEHPPPDYSPPRPGSEY